MAGPPGTKPLPQANGGSESDEEGDEESSEEEEAKTVSLICASEDEIIVPICSICIQSFKHKAVGVTVVNLDVFWSCFLMCFSG